MVKHQDMMDMISGEQKQLVEQAQVHKKQINELRFTEKFLKA